MAGTVARSLRSHLPYQVHVVDAGVCVCVCVGGGGGGGGETKCVHLNSQACIGGSY